VDNPGVTNAVLMKENQRLATIYKNRSVAEQNSFDMAWDLFMDGRFDASVDFFAVQKGKSSIPSIGHQLCHGDRFRG